LNSIEVIKKFIESNWMIERAVREILERLPLRFRYGISYGPTFRYWLGFLRESEKWDRDRLEAYQVEQIRNLLIHAGKNVPYYKKIFREYGFKPEKVQSLNDIKVLPCTDKETVRDNLNDFIAINIPMKSLFNKSTSGSTGIPLTIYSDKRAEEKHWATVIHQWSRAGYYIGARTVFFETTMKKGKTPVPWKKHLNFLRVSSNFFTDGWMDRISGMIYTFKPEFLIGFPSMLANFASYFTVYNKNNLTVKGIITYSEKLYSWQRALLEKTFSAKIIETYGMVEKLLHGGNCENSSALHFYPQYGYTEYTDFFDQKKQVVGTGFINRVMPLIRYMTSDICQTTSRTRCEGCGRNYDIIEEIEGREGDFLINADGYIISINLSLDYTIMKKIKQFQIVQEKPGEAEILIIKRTGYTAEDTDRFLSGIRESLGILGGEMDLSIKFSDEPLPMKGIKIPMIIQKLDIRDFLKQ
jgi:phenylacetate-CoA ligase